MRCVEKVTLEELVFRGTVGLSVALERVWDSAATADWWDAGGASHRHSWGKKKRCGWRSNAVLPDVMSFTGGRSLLPLCPSAVSLISWLLHNHFNEIQTEDTCLLSSHYSWRNVSVDTRHRWFGLVSDRCRDSAVFYLLGVAGRPCLGARGKKPWVPWENKAAYLVLWSFTMDSNWFSTGKHKLIYVKFLRQTAQCFSIANTNRLMQFSVIRLVYPANYKYCGLCEHCYRTR